VTEIVVLVVVVAVLAVGGFGLGIIASRGINRWEDRSEEVDDGEP
jgi:hypothetical protein